MSKRLARNPTFKTDDVTRAYSRFDAINGKHPWQETMPEGHILYPVRELGKGKVLYFNFGLAREMGLLPASHPDLLNEELSAKILETFAVQIINEYDQEHGIDPNYKIKSHPYMATRYLQLQHSNKQGRTSGDGRSVWNGSVEFGGVRWDVSSRGTGVTRLSPGAVEANRNLKTGETEFGYGCGLADVTELLGSALLSEIFHGNGLGTERVLTIIDLGKGCGIGVRAAPNLIRPAHLFLFLKQGRLEPLRRAADFLIERQVANGKWSIPLRAKDRYKQMLNALAVDFARFAAQLEREYIFAWLDWDGDNVLASAGIIDYGSIRQFGVRHDQYRYDDVSRFSTNLNEQRGKARATIQVFAQLVEFAETGKRRPVQDYANCAAARLYDREFDSCLRERFLEQVGYDSKQIAFILKSKRREAESLYQAFLVLEKQKTKAGQKRLPDGVNRPAVFNMRSVLREMPRLLLFAMEEGFPKLEAEDLLEVMETPFAKKADLRLRGGLRTKIDTFIRCYTSLLRNSGWRATNNSKSREALRLHRVRAERRNFAGRVTGNGAEFVVDELLKAKRRGVSQADLQKALTMFIAAQTVGTGSAFELPSPRAFSLQSPAGRLYQSLVNVAFEFQHDI